MCINSNFQRLLLGDTIYKNENIQVIEIKERQNHNLNFLKIDSKLYDNEREILFLNEPIYFIHFDNNNEILIRQK